MKRLHITNYFLLLNLIGIFSLFLILYNNELNNTLKPRGTYQLTTNDLHNTKISTLDKEHQLYVSKDNQLLNKLVKVIDQQIDGQDNSGEYRKENVNRANEQTNTSERSYIRSDGSVYFQNIGNVFVYSAYYDDIEQPVVRIVAIALLVPYEQKFECSYTDDGNTSASAYRGRLQYVPEPDSWGYSYRAAFIICDVPRDRKPEYVSLNGNMTKGDNSLKIIFPSKQKWRLTRCFSVLHSDFSNDMQFIQTIEFSRLFGVEHFVIYVHNANEAAWRTLRYYQKVGVLEILEWNLPVNKSQIHYYGQMVAIQECIYRNMYTSEYVLTGDTDEIFVPKSYKSLTDMIEDNFKGRSYCSALIVRNSFFPLNLPPPDTDFPFRADALELNLTYLLHTKRIKVNQPAERSKVILKPKGVTMGSIHEVTGYRKGKGGCVCPYNLCLLHHYRHVEGEHRGDFVIDASLQTYSQIIVKRIQRLMRNISSGL